MALVIYSLRIHFLQNESVVVAVGRGLIRVKNLLQSELYLPSR